MTLFDISIFLGVLLAMLLSSMPKKFAMAVCLGVSLWGLLINSFMPETTIFPLAGIAEAGSALLLIISARFLHEKLFFYIMAGFLLASASLNVIYIPIYLYTDTLTFGMYTKAFHTIAVLHVLTMLIWSNGIGQIIRSVRGFVFRNYSDHFGV